MFRRRGQRAGAVVLVVPAGLLAFAPASCSRSPEPGPQLAEPRLVPAPPTAPGPSPRGAVVTPGSPSSAPGPGAPLAALPPPLASPDAIPGSRRGVVVAVEPLAAAAGVHVLERGGNAVDAAIATTLTLCVTHSSAASLGGGGFALVRRDGAATEAFDFREVAPRALTRPSFDRMIAAGARGPLAVGVPGTVAGLALLHERFGSRPFAELVAPAIALARDGHTLREWQARVLGWSYPALAHDPVARGIFGRAGKVRRAGARLVQADLAATLERLATSGADDFYRGETARRLAAALAPDGPSLADLAAYRAVPREPLRFGYRGYGIETMPPPSAGGVTLAGILLATQALAPVPPARGSAESIHTLLEAARRAQAERRLGVVDPDALGNPELVARTARWLDAAFWLKVPIDPTHATPSERVHALYPVGPRESEHTTHLSVADARGMVVSLTTTLSASFGAKFVARSTGIVLNNAVASFSVAGDNQPAPGKRTTSSMAPTLLLRGDRVAAVLGTPGGDSIPSTLAQVVQNLVDHRLPLDRAITAPRWHHGFVPDVARYEPPADSALLLELTRRGHQLKPFRRPIGDANCIVLDTERAYGFADPREHGSSLAPSETPALPPAATLR